MTAHAPPPVPLGHHRAVAVDIHRIEAAVTFDVAARTAHAQASVDFALDDHDGCPALDLRQRIDELRLDGGELAPDAFSHQDLGGGPDARMRVLDRELTARTRHRLELRYRLDTPDAAQSLPIAWSDGVRFDLWMSDLHPGRYLEMWLPANLCHDRFSLSVELTVVGAEVDHVVLTNGAERALGRGRWRVDYPAHFTALSPMLVLAPAAELEVRQCTVEIAGRRDPLSLLTARLVEVDADLASCEADVAAWLAYNTMRYGRWAHGDRFTAVVWGPGRGMEYDGATTAAVPALEHEVFHSWFGRGVKPAAASDGWIDEAWTSWATSTTRGDEGRFAATELGLDEPPVVLYPPHPWSRFTPVAAYREGARLFSGLAHLLGGPDRLRQAMAGWYQDNAGGLVTTAGLERSLARWSGVDLGPWFARYVHGDG